MLRIVIFFVLLVAINVQLVNGLKCHMCGQYNEGGGSITPCLNYSDVQASNFLKECTKPTDKYCVVYHLLLLFINKINIHYYRNMLANLLL
ncbi:hypothetical protein ACFFRR_009585 [Megaselia abdita]